MIKAMLKGIAMVWGVGLAVVLIGELLRYDAELGIILLATILGCVYGLICFSRD